MLTRRRLVGSTLSALVLGSGAVLGQQEAAATRVPAALEFPVIMRQNVTAGKTPAGTKIKAKLTVATLLKGVVFPRDAVFSGEVAESVAKSATGPSRLAIRMDLVEWKNGSAPIKVYLTGWYYPTRLDMGPNRASGSIDSSVSWGTGRGGGTHRNPASQPFPDNDSDGNSDSLPIQPLAVTSDHRVMMKNVESARTSDGSVVITCKRSNIKLDKSTTYVLAASELVPSK